MNCFSHGKKGDKDFLIVIHVHTKQTVLGTVKKKLRLFRYHYVCARKMKYSIITTRVRKKSKHIEVNTRIRIENIQVFGYQYACG